MKNKEIAVNLIINEIKNQVHDYYKDWDIQSYKDYIENVYNGDSKLWKNDVEYILTTEMENHEEQFLTDDLDIIDGIEITSYRKLMTEVRNKINDYFSSTEVKGNY